MEVTLKAERPVLIVNVGEEQKRLPLTFTRVEMERIGRADDKNAATIEFFRTYLGDVIDQIGDDDFNVLWRAWLRAREEAGMPEAGEA